MANHLQDARRRADFVRAREPGGVAGVQSIVARLCASFTRCLAFSLSQTWDDQGRAMPRTRLGTCTTDRSHGEEGAHSLLWRKKESSTNLSGTTVEKSGKRTILFLALPRLDLEKCLRPVWRGPSSDSAGCSEPLGRAPARCFRLSPPLVAAPVGTGCRPRR